MSNDRLADFAAAGVSIWLDDPSGERLRGGNLQSLLNDRHVVDVTQPDNLRHPQDDDQVVGCSPVTTMSST